MNNLDPSLTHPLLNGMEIFEISNLTFLFKLEVPVKVFSNPR